MDETTRSSLRAQALDREVRDDLIGVHVRRRTRAGLEDVDDEVVIPLPVHHVLRGGDDCLRLLRIEQTQLAVHFGGRQLDLGEGTDESTVEAKVTDREVQNGALR